ncbi:MAG: molybdenum cofactor guanylyltransferase [Bacteroidota bacterium]
MSLHREITGVILAGGKSRRIGKDKAFLTVDGETFLTRITRTMRSVFEQIYIISNDGSYRFFSLPVFKDLYQGCGPLAGIHAGLLHSRTQASFVVPCDTPFISEELIEYIISFGGHADVVVPMTEEKLHPLCGLYSRRCLSVIEESLRNRRVKVRDVLTRLYTVVIPITPRLSLYRSDLLLNVNELKDYDLATHSGEHPSPGSP